MMIKEKQRERKLITTNLNNRLKLSLSDSKYREQNRHKSQS